MIRPPCAIMIRQCRAVLVVVLLVAGMPHSVAQPQQLTPRAALREAQRLNQQAMKLYSEGKFGDAVAPAQQALWLREQVLGPMHPDVAQSLNNLALVYDAQGAYAKAEPLYSRAFSIRSKVLGPMHPDVAGSLNNLALLYESQGAYGRAEPMLREALSITEKAFGPMHPRMATSLNNLATLYQRERRYDKAVPLQVRALDILEKSVGPMHRELAGALNNLAELYTAQGAYDRAEPLYVRALGILEKALGPAHPEVATCLNNLAALYRARGAYGKAEPLYLRALGITEAALGHTHRDVADQLQNLATLYWAQSAYDKALPLQARATEIEELQLRTDLPRLPVSRKRAAMALLQGETDSLVSFQADAMPNNAAALELALTTILRRKGRILDLLVDQAIQLRTHLTSDLRAKLDKLGHDRAQLVAMLYPPAGELPDDPIMVDMVRDSIDRLESELGAASGSFRAQVESVSMAKVQGAVPAGAALVEFVRYTRFDPRQPRPWQEARYVAYVLSAHHPPQWVALGEAAAVDAQIEAMLATMGSKVPADSARAALRRLDALVLAPIRARLVGVSHVILAPDSKLNLVPFEALVDPEGHHALQAYTISYVTTGRDLLRLSAHRAPRSAATIMAAPEYGPLKSEVCGGLGSMCPLVGALAEAGELQRYFPAAPLTGAKATKSALAALTGPAILHVATHGFFARGSRASPAPQRSVSPPTTPGRGMAIESSASPQLPPHAEDPIHGIDLAGLAMAGANQGPEGIVTARDIAGYDWWGTQLVVLSACETGVGAVSSSADGVYGMRRALTLAGVESQVVSLWSVSDGATRVLMGDYYGELARGTGRAEALRQAKLRLMAQPRHAHPYYWAAFIPAGDWRPLDASVFSPRTPSP